MMKTFLPIVLASTVLPTLAYASDTANDSGFYIGGGAGSVDFEDDGFSDDINFNPFTNAKSEANDNSKKVFAGYRFNKIIGVEISYTDYGVVNFSQPDFVIFNTTFQGLDVDWEIESISVAANVGYTFENGLRPFGIIGLSSVDIDEDGGFLSSGSGTGVHYGLGLEYAPLALKNIAFRMGYEADVFGVDAEDIDDDLIDYTMEVGSYYLSASMHF